MSRLLLITTALLAWLLVSGPVAAKATDFQLLDSRVYLKDDSYLLDARIDVALTEGVLEALNSGVPLEFNLELEVVEKRPVFWDRVIRSRDRAFRLRYHTLSRTYLLTRLENDETSAHHTLSSAIGAMANLKAEPLMRRGGLYRGLRYGVRLRLGLDLDALPSPLQVPARFSKDWQLVSPWFKWPLTP
ncbi:MAG: DUF4390 domain-containing protein [Gammaproteobacteria bacterium]